MGFFKYKRRRINPYNKKQIQTSEPIVTQVFSSIWDNINYIEDFFTIHTI